MNRINKIIFAEMQKIVITTLCVVCTMSFMTTGCGANTKLEKSDDDFDKTEAILGKWEIIAYGMTDEQMRGRDWGVYWEFFPDGSVRTFMPGYFPAEDSDGLFIGIGTYTIDKDFLVRKYYDEDGNCWAEERFRYEFKENQLKLTRDPMDIPNWFEGENVPYILITNIHIFKKL